MRIVFCSHGNQIPTFAAFARLLDEHYEVKIELWVLGGPCLQEAERHPVFDTVINLSREFELDEISVNRYRSNLSWFRDLEEETGEVFFKEDLGADRYLHEGGTIRLRPSKVPSRWNPRNSSELLRTVGETVRTRMEHGNIDGFYMEKNSAVYRLIWRLAGLYDVPSVYWHTSRHWSDRGFFESCLNPDWEACRDNYKEFSDRTVPDAVREMSQRRLAEIRKKRRKPKYFSESAGRGQILEQILDRADLGYLYEQFERWVKSYQSEWRANPRVLPSRSLSPVRKLERFIHDRRKEAYYRKHFQKEVDTEGAYAIYFLHHYPEMVVDNAAFEYRDQVATVRNLAAALPADVPLYVKEHPMSSSKRHLDFYSEFAHMPSVTLLRHTIDSHTLIEQAAVVLTLAGTVALEAIYYGTPAVVLGDVFFKNFEGIHHPDHFEEAHSLLASPKGLEAADEEAALRTLAAMYEASFPSAPVHKLDEKPDLVRNTADRLVELFRDEPAGSQQNEPIAKHRRASGH